MRLIVTSPGTSSRGAKRSTDATGRMPHVLAVTKNSFAVAISYDERSASLAGIASVEAS
jgi:hypothetical protein